MIKKIDDMKYYYKIKDFCNRYYNADKDSWGMNGTPYDSLSLCENDGCRLLERKLSPNSLMLVQLSIDNNGKLNEEMLRILRK